ncbi:MAG TPA: hypothetical protein VHN16_06810 [Streptosporangiaceae bacterium]|nr:hypothetical protein [Streptosporangiaceae bacterium]
MTAAVLAASGLLIAIGSVPYLIETLRGTAKPQVVSWAVWAALLAIGSAAALSSGQVPAAVYGALCAGVDALVAVLALRGADLAFRRLDFLCLAGAVAGLALLATVRAPAAAVAVSVAADLIAYIPTMVHAWRKPREETWSAYALYAAAAWLALAVADFGVFTAVAYPAYLAVADTGMTGIILARRGTAPESASPGPTASDGG